MWETCVRIAACPMFLLRFAGWKEVRGWLPSGLCRNGHDLPSTLLLCEVKSSKQLQLAIQRLITRTVVKTYTRSTPTRQNIRLLVLFPNVISVLYSLLCAHSHSNFDILTGAAPNMNSSGNDWQGPTLTHKYFARAIMYPDRLNGN